MFCVTHSYQYLYKNQLQGNIVKQRLITLGKKRWREMTWNIINKVLQIMLSKKAPTIATLFSPSEESPKGESPKKKQREEHNKEVTQTPLSWVDLVPTGVWSRNFSSHHLRIRKEFRNHLIQPRYFIDFFYWEFDIQELNKWSKITHLWIVPRIYQGWTYYILLSALKIWLKYI